MPLRRFLLAWMLALLLPWAIACADENPTPANAWAKCCAVAPWPASRPWPADRIKPDPATFARYRPRQAQLRTSGVPQPYAAMVNPLPRTAETVERGRLLFGAQCAVCHGVSGNGEGVGGHDMIPPPGRLNWVADVPALSRDGYLYWTISEGGQPFGTGMTAFGGTLATDDIWAIAAYVLARLPDAVPTTAPPPS